MNEARASDRKLRALSREDIQQAPDPEILEFLLEDCRCRRLSSTIYRVLDFGCGRGELVGRLRHAGLDAFGVDIQPQYVENSGPLHDDSSGGFSVISLTEKNRTQFPDAMFHAVISDQTLEHVSDLASAVSEMSRVLMPNGVTYHRFPAKFAPIETHCHMPFVHWLPKSRLRMPVISFFYRTGVLSPGWRGRGPESIYRYLNDHTFYRDLAAIRDVFAAHHILIDSRKEVRKWILTKVPKVPIALLGVATGLAARFHHCRIVGRKTTQGPLAGTLYRVPR